MMVMEPSTKAIADMCSYMMGCMTALNVIISEDKIETHIPKQLSHPVYKTGPMFQLLRPLAEAVSATTGM